MDSLSILYIGVDSGTSRHRAHALERLGHRVTILNPRTFVAQNRVVNYLIHHIGGTLFEARVRQRILKYLPASGYELVWVDVGELIGPALVRKLKHRYGPVVNYNHDDPYGKRDGWKFKLYLRAVPFYDVVTVVRQSNVAEAQALGAQKVLLLYRSADEVAHSPRELSAADRAAWSSDVVFIGTWMPERGPFLKRLVDLGVPLSIYGDNWSKAREWPALQSFWKGPGLYKDDDYAKAVQCAKVCLGLLSEGNRDLSTTRSFEIPALGGVFCATRTPEHETLYREEEEAVFWSTPEECAAQCKRLLADDQFRLRIARQGRARCLQNNTMHEPTLEKIISNALSLQTQEPHAVACDPVNAAPLA